MTYIPSERVHKITGFLDVATACDIPLDEKDINYTTGGTRIATSFTNAEVNCPFCLKGINTAPRTR